MRMISARVARPLAMTLLPILLLAGCVTMTGSSVATRSALCDQFKAIRWVEADTDATIAQAKSHNAVGVRLCGWKP
jgi:hypothetical protein